MAHLVIRQFTVRRLRGGGRARLVLILQSHLLEGVDTVIVAPLLRGPRPLSAGIAMTLEVDGEEYQVPLNQLGAVPMPMIGPELASAADREDEIRHGVDRLFTGF